MTPSHDASRDATPRHVLPLRASQVGPSLDGIVRGVAAEVEQDRREQRRRPVSITIDVGARRTSVADFDGVRELLLPLVAAACDAATAPAPASDGPPLHEVVITAVETSRGVEIEVADSGPGPARLSADVVAAARRHAERLGGKLMITACPDGGTAMTLCLPSTREQAQAIRPAA